MQVAKVVKKKDAHDMAKRIHSFILQTFNFETVVRLNADVDEHMIIEKNKDEIENNLTKDEKTCDDKNKSLFISQFVLTNATSIESSMGSSSVRFILLSKQEIRLLTLCKVMKSNLQTDIYYCFNELSFIISIS